MRSAGLRSTVKEAEAEKEVTLELERHLSHPPAVLFQEIKFSLSLSSLLSPLSSFLSLFFPPGAGDETQVLCH